MPTTTIGNIRLAKLKDQVLQQISKLHSQFDLLPDIQKNRIKRDSIGSKLITLEAINNLLIRLEKLQADKCPDIISIIQTLPEIMMSIEESARKRLEIAEEAERKWKIEESFLIAQAGKRQLEAMKSNS